MTASLQSGPASQLGEVSAAVYDAASSESLDYFKPLLPWQQQAWSQLTVRAAKGDSTLPHAMLAAGIKGMGKRRFVWRLVAWLLCHQRNLHPQGACGKCESCEWLRSGTHPNLQVLPALSLISAEQQDSDQSVSKSTNKSANKDKSAAPSRTIKIDDIRQLISFVHQGSQGIRVCVFDHAEQMTIGAANALLKTLEEPQPQVHLILITDSPAQLLPTIKSRVQKLPLNTIPAPMAKAYISSQLGFMATTFENAEEATNITPEHGSTTEAITDSTQINQLLALANGAPLAAVAMATAPWYDKRQLWLTTWLALRAGKRSALAASDYWQQQLCLKDFTQLTELMLIDISRVALGLSSLQRDCDINAAVPREFMPSTTALNKLAEVIADSKRAIQQNVQEKLAYDKLLQHIALT